MPCLAAWPRNYARMEAHAHGTQATTSVWDWATPYIIIKVKITGTCVHRGHTASATPAGNSRNMKARWYTAQGVKALPLSHWGINIFTHTARGCLISTSSMVLSASASDIYPR